MSVQTASHQEVHVNEEEAEEEELDEEEEEDAEDEDFEENEEVTHGRSPGRGLTLKTLLKEGVLVPGEGHMTINYLGNKFKGDLLADGRIHSQETNKIFGSPSAWAIYCKKIVNPDKKSGCGWASVRYKGKKLDSYKNNWYRQKRLEFEREGEALDEEEMTDSDSDGPHEQEIVEFEMIGNRHPNHDMNTMVELTSFQALGRMQPFSVTMSSSAMAMIDIHGHLSTSEVVGYLAGQWDVTNHNLIVSHALPLRCHLKDAENGQLVEQRLAAEMEKLNLSLVGWYHTHPFSPPLPSLRDIDTQLEYELKMKGSNDASYTPCIGLIVSPYVKGGGQGTTASGFWVMPPPEHKPQEYGRPMSIQFTIVQDAFMPKETLIHVRDTVKYYKDSSDSVAFGDIFQDRFTYWDKLKAAIRLCVPRDHYAPLLDYLAKLLELKNYTPEPVPPPGKPKPTLTIGGRQTQLNTSDSTATTTSPVVVSSTTPFSTPTSLLLRSKHTPDLLHGDPDHVLPKPPPPVIDVSPDEPKPPPSLSILPVPLTPLQSSDTPTHGRADRPLPPSHLELLRHDLFKTNKEHQQHPLHQQQQQQQQEGKGKLPSDHPLHVSKASPPPPPTPPLQYKQLFHDLKLDIAPHPGLPQEHLNHHHRLQQQQQHKHQPIQHHSSQHQASQHLHSLSQLQQHLFKQQNQQQKQHIFGDPPHYHPMSNYQHYHKERQQQHQQKEGFPSDQKSSAEEEVLDKYREPPPSYHQHHFKIPSTYHHEEPKGPPPAYPTEDRTLLDAARKQEGILSSPYKDPPQPPLVEGRGQVPHGQSEQQQQSSLPPPPAPAPPPTSHQQRTVKAAEDVQPMDVDANSSKQ